MAVKRPPTQARLRVGDTPVYRLVITGHPGTHNVGDQVGLQGCFTDSTGLPVDPHKVEFEIVDPSGVRRKLPATRVEQGCYQASVIVDQPHLWRWSCTGTGGVFASKASHFNVRHPL